MANGHIQAVAVDDTGRKRRTCDDGGVQRTMALNDPLLAKAVAGLRRTRTWNATVLAAAVLAGSSRSRRAVTRMYREVSEHLGNTPAVAKKSYVDPRLVDLYEHDLTIAPELAASDLASTRESVEQAVATC